MKADNIHPRLITLGDSIRARRVSEGLTQEKLGYMIGSGQSYIYRVEKGLICVGVDKLMLIADALNTTVSDLINF